MKKSDFTAIVGGVSPVGPLEVIHQPYYDITEWNNESTEITFFQRPIGMALPITVTTTKTKVHTNMTASGQLPAKTYFEIFGFRFLIPQELGDTDSPALLAQIFLGSVFEFRLQNKIYMQAPVIMAGAGAGLTFVSSGAAATLIQAQNGSNDARGFWMLKETIAIGESESFDVKLTLAQASTVTAARQVMCVMDGMLYRPIQ